MNIERSSWFAYWESRRTGTSIEKLQEPPLYIEDKIFLALAGKRRLFTTRGKEITKKVLSGLAKDTGLSGFLAGAIEGAREKIIHKMG